MLGLHRRTRFLYSATIFLLASAAAGGACETHPSEAEREGGAPESPDASTSDGSVAGGMVPLQPTCPPGMPSFAHDVMPVLRRSCGTMSWCHVAEAPSAGATSLLWLGPPAPLVPTSEELDEVHADLLAGSETNAGARIVYPDFPDASLLLLVAESSEQCASGACGTVHGAPPALPYVTTEEVSVLRSWIASGATNDSCSVAPPSTTPLLRIPLRIHAGQVEVDSTVLQTYAVALDEIARRAGICFETAIVSSEQLRSDALQLWLLPPDGGVYYEDQNARSVVPMTASTTALDMARTLLGVRNATPTQREIVTARERVTNHALSDTAPADCQPARVLEQERCGEAMCDPLDVGAMGVMLPPCCRGSDGPVDGGIGDVCGIEPYRMESLLPRWLVAERCVTPDGLVAPPPPSGLSLLDPACPTVQVSSVPLLGVLDLPGCCIPTFGTGVGTCGASSAPLPEALSLNTCLSAAALEEALGPIAPGIGDSVTALPCTPM